MNDSLTPVAITAQVSLTPREYANGYNRDLIYRHVFEQARDLLANVISRGEPVRMELLI